MAVGFDVVGRCVGLTLGFAVEVEGESVGFEEGFDVLGCRVVFGVLGCRVGSLLVGAQNQSQIS